LHKDNDTVATVDGGRDPSLGSAEWPTRTLTRRCGKMGYSAGMRPRARGTLTVRIGVGGTPGM